MEEQKKNYLIQRHFLKSRYYNTKHCNGANSVTLPKQAGLLLGSQAAAAVTFLAVHSKAGNLQQEPCGAVAYSPDATVLDTAGMENKWEDHFFLRRPPSVNAQRHSREEIPCLSCNPAYRIWPHKCTPCSSLAYEHDGCCILFFTTHQKQRSGGFLAGKSVPAAPAQAAPEHRWVPTNSPCQQGEE